MFDMNFFKWWRPNPLRPRCTPPTCEGKKRIPVANDPFEQCSSCKKPLLGFLAYHPAAKDNTVLLSCGHCLCPECLYKQSSRSTMQVPKQGLHSDSQFICDKCNVWVHARFLPHIVELMGTRCDTKDCHSILQTYRCQHCLQSNCPNCMHKHLNNCNQPLIQRELRPHKSGQTFARKYFTCPRHNVTSTTSCTACGDLTCGKCKTNYPETKAGATLTHNRVHMEMLFDPELEAAMHSPMENQKELKQMQAMIKQKLAQLSNRSDATKNEICLQFYNMINATLGRMYQVIAVVEKETEKVQTSLLTAEKSVLNALRRIDVACELDERCRDTVRLQDDFAAAVLKNEAYNIFRPASQDYIKALQILNHFKEGLPNLKIYDANTDAILDMICQWGKRVESECTVNGRRPSTVFTVDVYPKEVSWDKRTPVPPMIKNSMPSCLDWSNCDIHSDKLFYLSCFADIHQNQILRPITPRYFPFVKMKNVPPAMDMQLLAAFSAPTIKKPRVPILLDLTGPSTSAATAPLPIMPSSSGRNVPSISASRHPKLDSKSTDAPREWTVEQERLQNLWEKWFLYKPLILFYPKSLPDLDDLTELTKRVWTSDDKKAALVAYKAVSTSLIYRNCSDRLHKQLTTLLVHYNVQWPPKDKPTETRDGIHKYARFEDVPVVATLIDGERHEIPRALEELPNLINFVPIEQPPTVATVECAPKVTHPTSSTESKVEEAETVTVPTVKEAAATPVAVSPAPKKTLASIHSKNTVEKIRKANMMARLKDMTEREQPKAPEPVRETSSSKETGQMKRTHDGAVIFDDKPKVASDDGLSLREMDSDGTCMYCWVCNDDRGIDGEKGICSECPRVYHGKCHIPPVTGPWDALPDSWLCSVCDPVKRGHVVSTAPLDENTRKMCCKVLLGCYQEPKMAAWFSEPVKDEEGYDKVIADPMDLGTIAHNLNPDSENPIESTQDFILNMNLVFQNCATFNKGDSEVARAGKRVWKAYQESVKRYLPQHIRDVWLYISLHKGSESGSKRKSDCWATGVPPAKKGWAYEPMPATSSTVTPTSTPGTSRKTRTSQIVSSGGQRNDMHLINDIKPEV